MIDLHMHSNRSDGTDAPADLARRVLEAGLTTAALTDHDTTIGNDEYRAVLEDAGVGFIPGCEISCLHDFDGVERSTHVLSYFVEEGDTEFQRTLAGLMEDRGLRNARLVELLHSLGYVRIEASRIEEISGKPLARSNRPSFATAIIEAYGPGSDATGIAEGLPTGFTDIQDVFNRLLANDGPAYIKKAHLSPADAARVARASGAICVIAHPIITFCSSREEVERWSIGAKRDFLDDVFASLKADGLAGVEVFYSRHSPEEIEMLLGLTAKHRLVATGGSDFHGANKPDLSVGIGVAAMKGTSAELRVPDSVIAELERARTELCGVGG